MKNIKILSFFLALVMVFTGCEEEDYTGYSTLTPSNPTVSVDLGTITAVSDGVKSSHTINLSMDMAQIVDVNVHVLVVEGTATLDTDYSLSGNMVTIAAGRTTAKLVVSVLGDEVFEETETFKIQIGDERTANATITPVTADFTITNATEGDLAVALDWASNIDVYDVAGEVLAGDDIADLFLEVTDAAGTAVADNALVETLADGVYSIGVGINSAIDLGDQGDVMLDIYLDLAQVGVFTDAYEFTSLFPISKAEYCNLAVPLLTVTKAGSTWTVEEVAADVIGGDYGGTDGPIDGISALIYGSAVEVIKCGNNYYIDGLAQGIVSGSNWWGEDIASSALLPITFNADGSITVADQHLLTSLYAGSLYDYSIANVTGTWTASPMTLHIQYTVLQDGWDFSDYVFGSGYSSGPYFVADVVLGAANPSKKSVVSNSPLATKPY